MIEQEKAESIMFNCNYLPTSAMRTSFFSARLIAGKKAGTITVGITTGIDSVSTIKQIEPDYIIDQISDLIPLLLG